MARRPDAPNRIDLLVLSCLARLPMHGYELELELRYRHVRWWAKCEHGHLYAALARLERNGLLRRVSPAAATAARRPGRLVAARVERRAAPAARAQAAAASAGRGKRVYALTAAGRRHLGRALDQFGSEPDSTYFDVDLFLAGAFILEREEAIAVLRRRRAGLLSRRTEAEALAARMAGLVPVTARLIMNHRLEHLAHELAFTDRAIEEIGRSGSWGPFLGAERIGEFLARTGARLEAAR